MASQPSFFYPIPGLERQSSLFPNFPPLLLRENSLTDFVTDQLALAAAQNASVPTQVHHYHFFPPSQQAGSLGASPLNLSLQPQPLQAPPTLELPPLATLEGFQLDGNLPTQSSSATQSASANATSASLSLPPSSNAPFLTTEVSAPLPVAASRRGTKRSRDHETPDKKELHRKLDQIRRDKQRVAMKELIGELTQERVDSLSKHSSMPIRVMQAATKAIQEQKEEIAKLHLHIARLKNRGIKQEQSLPSHPISY